MATRFYFPSSGAAAVSPAFDASWTQTTNAARLAMVTTRISSAMATIDGVGNTNSTTRQLIRQYVSAQVAAQTLSGSIKGQIRCTTNALGSAALSFRVAKCAGDGSSVVEIVALTEAADAETNAPPAFENGTVENRRFETPPANTFSITFSDTTLNNGDRLIIELGYKEGSANGANVSSLVIGDDSGTDLPEDETTTTSDNPWAEFTDDITFGGGETITLDKWMARYEIKRRQRVYMVSSGMTPPDRVD